MFTKSKRGMTLVEALVVTAVFSVVFFTALGMATSLNTTWENGSMQIDLQQDATQAMDRICKLLHQSTASWRVGTATYPVTISGDGNRIDFYIPEYNDSYEIIKLHQARICTSTNDSNTLVQRIGSPAQEEIVGLDIDITQGPIFRIDSTYPYIVRIEVPIKKGNSEFSINSSVGFRNFPPQLDETVSVVSIPN